MKGAIAGFGNIAENSHLPAFRKLGMEIEACVDVSAERRKKAEKLGIKAFSHLDEIEKLDLDFIDITTPPSFRYEPVKFAIENNLDVICEKPLTLPGKIAELKSLVKSSKNQVFIFPIHNWKHSPHYEKAKALVKESGADKIKISVLRTSHAKGCSEWCSDWRVKPEHSGGGIIMDHGYHNIYLASFILDAEIKNAKLCSIEYGGEKSVEKKALFKLFFNSRKEKEAEIYLDWCADKREVSCTAYRGEEIMFMLKEDKITSDGKEHFFDKKISENSLHADWTYESIKEFRRERKRKSKKYLLEGMKVIEIIKVLYAQASVLR